MLPTLRPGLGKYASRIYSIVRVLPWSSDEHSVFDSATPAVANGDMSVCTVTSPGSYEVDLTSTGVLVIDTLGSTARQSFYCDVYDWSLRKWYGDTIEWVNNALPVYDGSVGFVTVQSGTPTTINLNTAVTDAEADVLTYTIVDGHLPPGLTLATDGTISGTPSG